MHSMQDLQVSEVCRCRSCIRSRPEGDATSMSICCGPKVHQTLRLEPSFRVTSNFGSSGFLVRISSRSSLLGRPAHRYLHISARKLICDLSNPTVHGGILDSICLTPAIENVSTSHLLKQGNSSLFVSPPQRCIMAGRLVSGHHSELDPPSPQNLSQSMNMLACGESSPLSRKSWNWSLAGEMWLTISSSIRS